MSAPARAAAAGRAALPASPSGTRARRRASRSRPARIRSSVVFPAPLGPESATRSRRSTGETRRRRRGRCPRLLAEVGCDNDRHGWATVDSAPWRWLRRGHIRGSDSESCNCDAICPCRRIDGIARGRSTHGVCTGVLSWLIAEGAAGDSTSRVWRSRSRSATATTNPARPGCGSSTSTRTPTRGAAGGTRGDLQRPARRRCAHALPVGVEGERAARRAPGGDRRRPHAPAPVAAHPRPRHRPDPRSFFRRRDRHVRDPRATTGTARSSITDELAGRRRPARFRLQRHLRLWRDLRLLRMTRSEELLALAQRVADTFPPEVVEVVLTGSVSRGVADDISDIEMLVVTEEQVSLEEAFELARRAGWKSGTAGATRRRRRDAFPAISTPSRSRRSGGREITRRSTSTSVRPTERSHTEIAAAYRRSARRAGRSGLASFPEDLAAAHRGRGRNAGAALPRRGC